MSKKYRFGIYLSARECQEYYQGLYTNIVVQTHTGLSLQLAAKHIRPFITREGVKGEFQLEVDDNNKFIGLTKLR